MSPQRPSARTSAQYTRVPSYRLSTLSTTRTSLDDAENDDPFEDQDFEDAGDEAGGKEKGLEQTLDRIGMGKYQYRVLVLCGLGWLADNMYLTCLAIILPRVEDEFGISAARVSSLSASIFTGMMIGAIGWGFCADAYGRTIPFKSTLGLTGVFGVASSYSASFEALNVWVFLVGTAVGGSMPTDGTIFLENCPTKQQYILTGLSVFFNVGAIISSVLGLVIIPSHSCPEHAPPEAICDVVVENTGWRLMLRSVSALSIFMFICRQFLFRLHESPRFLLATNKPEEALRVLKQIAKFNGLEHSFSLELQDVVPPPPSPAKTPPSESPNTNGREIADGRAVRGGWSGSGSLTPAYASTDESGPRPQYPFKTPTREQNFAFAAGLRNSLDAPSSRPSLSPQQSHARSRSFERPEAVRTGSRSPLAGAWLTPEGEGDEDGEDAEGKELLKGREQEAVKPAVGFKEKGREGVKMGDLFVPKWRQTTILMWIIWGAMSLAYTSFNSFLPILLEQRVDPTSSKGGRVEALQEVVFFAIAGCPGALLGALLIETSFGRRKSLSIFTFLTGLATLAFSLVETKGGVILSSCLISVSGTAMYSVLYGLTPETFPTSIRGTACGTASAISRLTGISAPLLTGYLLTLSPSFPLWMSAGTFGLAGLCCLGLPYERASDADGGGKEREEGGLD